MLVVYGLTRNLNEVSGLKRREAFNLLAFCQKAFDLKTDAHDLQQTYARLSARPIPPRMRKALDTVMADIASGVFPHEMRNARSIARDQIRAL